MLERQFSTHGYPRAAEQNLLPVDDFATQDGQYMNLIQDCTCHSEAGLWVVVVHTALATLDQV